MKLGKTDFILIKAHFKGFYRYIFTGFNAKGEGVYVLMFEDNHYDLNLKSGQLVNQRILSCYDVKYYCDTKRPNEAWCLSKDEMPNELVVKYH